ncbi:hypothetical protein, partial [Legionella pneumophila]|uniref:hypothetical protein n=1 Tax=Legionella pneumophila TaxID=446 RepID=UPI001E341C38
LLCYFKFPKNMIQLFGLSHFRLEFPFLSFIFGYTLGYTYYFPLGCGFMALPQIPATSRIFLLLIHTALLIYFVIGED